MNTLAEANQRIKELEHEVEIWKDAAIGLEEINMKVVDGKPEAKFSMSGPAMKRIIEALCWHFVTNGGENFLETSFEIRPAVTSSEGVREVGEFTFTIQRKKGITPAQKCAMLQKQIASLQADLAERGNA